MELVGFGQTFRFCLLWLSMPTGSVTFRIFITFCAGAYSSLPGCEAVMMAKPMLCIVRILPLMVATLSSLLVNCTGSPEVAAAANTTGSSLSGKVSS